MQRSIEDLVLDLVIVIIQSDIGYTVCKLSGIVKGSQSTEATHSMCCCGVLRLCCSISRLCPAMLGTL